MTKSTGKRAEQRRREELFWAEITLRRIGLHLQAAMGYASRAAELRDLGAAYGYVRTAHLDVRAEQTALDVRG